MKKTKVGTVIPNSDQKLPNGRYSKRVENIFKNITVFRVSQREKVSKNTIFMIKMIVFLLQFLKGNCWTAVQCAVGNSSLT